MSNQIWRDAGLAALISITSLGAANAQPQGTPFPAAIATPRDEAYPGVITLEVDATDTARGIFRIRETIPVQGGPLTLLYPQWIPGAHGPRGPIQLLAGLQVRANGQVIPWRRDTVNVYAFHIDAPQGVSNLEVSYQYLSPTAGNQGGVSVTPDLMTIQWQNMVLYPAGYYATRVRVAPRLTLPESWQFATALDGAQTQGQTTLFAETDLETLVDSPLYAGRHFRRIDLDPGGPAPFHLNVVADRASQLEISDEHIRLHRNLVQQMYRLYGSRPFDHYEFLFYLSDRLYGLTGIEHHRSSENGTGPGYFSDWDNHIFIRELFPHELNHAWNGKFRRPADLWTPEYSTPMRGSLLWVYEGMTKYYGYVLAARAGLWTRQEGLDALAFQAALYANRVGRSWRSVEDTTNDPIILYRRPQPWRSWQRGEDYYAEGLLVWLDADTLIRERSGGRRSLDDVARLFFGGENGSWEVSTYTFDDVVAALNQVQPYDWATFLRDRIERAGTEPPLDGVSRGGYRLVYGEERSSFIRSVESYTHTADFMYSIGIEIGDGGAVSQVQWDSPAFNQNLTIGTTIVAVNNQAYSAEALRRAISAARDPAQDIVLLVKNGDQFRTVTLEYHDGLRYPRFERVSGSDRLGAILSPRSR